MKNIFILLVILLTMSVALIGCQKENKLEITTFDEVIENGKVEIDGVEYHIESTTETTYEYDNNNNLITTIFNDDNRNSKRYTKFKYENNILIEEIIDYEFLSNIVATVVNDYDDGKRLKGEMIEESGNTTSVEYLYNDQTCKIIFKDEDGNMSGYIEEILDDKNNVLTSTSFDGDGNVGIITNNYYEDNKLIRAIFEYSYGAKRTYYYEYNNLGEMIFSYAIDYRNEELFMTVNFFEYEYNKDYLPVAMKLHKVEAFIIQDKVRNYWE